MKYEDLKYEFNEAHNQAANGKGQERHAIDGVDDFADEYICFIEKHCKSFAIGQAIKKLLEASNMDDPEKAIFEIHGAMNYAGAACITLRENIQNEKETDNQTNTH